MAPAEAPRLPAFDRRLGFLALVAVPLVAGLVLGLSLALGPLAGAALGLVALWAVMGGGLLAWADRDWLIEWMAARWPGWPVALLLGLPVLALGATVLRLLGQDPLPPQFILAAAIAAVVQAVLGELFWRGALIPDPTPGSAALSLGLFTLAQGVWLAALGLETGWPPLAPLAAGLAFGGVLTAARLLTGTVGAGLLAQAGLHLFAFAQVLALNL